MYETGSGETDDAGAGGSRIAIGRQR